MKKKGYDEQLQVGADENKRRLEKANEYRLKRYTLLRALKQGEVKLITVFKAKPEWAKNMKIFEMLNYSTEVGPDKSEEFLKSVGISYNRTLPGLTDAQYKRLLAAAKELPPPIKAKKKRSAEENK